MNNFQKVTQNIHELIKFLVENSEYSEKYWRDYLEKEVEDEKTR